MVQVQWLQADTGFNILDCLQSLLVRFIKHFLGTGQSPPHFPGPLTEQCPIAFRNSYAIFVTHNLLWHYKPLLDAKIGRFAKIIPIFDLDSIALPQKHCQNNPLPISVLGNSTDADLDGGRVDFFILNVIVMTNTIIFLAVLASFIGFFIWKETDSRKKNRRVWRIVEDTPLSEQNVKDLLTKLGATSFSEDKDDGGLYFIYQDELF